MAGDSSKSYLRYREAVIPVQRVPRTLRIALTEKNHWGDRFKKSASSEFGDVIILFCVRARKRYPSSGLLMGFMDAWFWRIYKIRECAGSCRCDCDSGKASSVNADLSRPSWAAWWLAVCQVREEYQPLPGSVFAAKRVVFAAIAKAAENSRQKRYEDRWKIVMERW